MISVQRQSRRGPIGRCAPVRRLSDGRSGWNRNHSRWRRDGPGSLRAPFDKPAEASCASALALQPVRQQQPWKCRTAGGRAGKRNGRSSKSRTQCRSGRTIWLNAATPHQSSTPAVLARLTAALLLWSSGVITLGALYGTENLFLQLLVVLAAVPFIWWYFFVGAQHTTPKSWTVTVHGLVALTIPAVVVGIRSWWLLLVGRRAQECVLVNVAEYEDSRGLRYEHNIRCGNQLVDYTSRGDPAGQEGHTLNVLLDPTGIIAAMPAHSAPAWWAWATPIAVAAILTTGLAELLRTRQPDSGGKIEP